MAARSGPGDLLELQEDDQLARLVKEWNFQRGKDFEASIFARFKSPVHHPSSSPRGAFHLLAVFRRYTFRLTESSVSLALHSILGGAPAGFHVTFIRDRHFRFSVSTKQVGFTVSELKRIISDILMFIFIFGEMVEQIGTESGINGKRKRMLLGSMSQDAI
jgi:hypothetical protein